MSTQGSGEFSLLKSNSKSSSVHLQTNQQTYIPPVLHVKSKFDAEFRRFSCNLNADAPMSYGQFRDYVAEKHSLENMPFTLCYTSTLGDLLPITNDENFHKSFESARPTLRILVQRKGESWEEKYGYGTGTLNRKRKGLSSWMPASGKPQRRPIQISNPEDFRQVSAIIDVDIVPDTHRRVRLCKHGSDRPLGFYIRPGTSVRITPQGTQKAEGFFISRLVAGGLAESTGLISVNDEILECNGIDVQGKTVDQVTDMMVANAYNLIVTIKPANQRNTLTRGDTAAHADPQAYNYSAAHYSNSHNAHDEESDSEDEEDIIISHDKH